MDQDNDNGFPERAKYEAENQFHGHDGPLFDSNIAGRASPGTLVPRNEHQLDYYFQEIERIVEYLTRCVVWLKYLRHEDMEKFENSRKHFRNGTGEDPLRTWEVRIHSLMGILRDIRDKNSHEAGKFF
jgi:hypothetical protein